MSGQVRLWVVVATVGVLIGGTACSAAHVGSPESPSALQSVASPIALLLGDVPGLGDTDETSLRDDTIAAWETWTRAQRVRECMAAAGFEWQPEVNYPRDPLLDLARSLGVQPAAGANRPHAAAINRAYQKSLSRSELNAYYRALFDESASDVAYVHDNSSGQLPPGRRNGRPWASGGCVGDAASQVGSLWQLKTDLGDDLLPLRLTRHEPLSPQVLQDYPSIRAQLTRYTGAMDRIAADDEFMAYLATVIGGEQALAAPN